MSRRRSLFALLGGVVLCLGMGSPVAAQSQTMHFTVVERATTDTVVDNDPVGVDNIGDLLGFGNKLYNAGNSRRVGRDEGFCVRTNPGKSWECSWTNIFHHGQITVQGPFKDNGKDTWLAITGGTGRYANATGQMRLHWRNPAGTEFDFEFWVTFDRPVS